MKLVGLRILTNVTQSSFSDKLLIALEDGYGVSPYLRLSYSDGRYPTIVDYRVQSYVDMCTNRNSIPLEILSLLGMEKHYIVEYNIKFATPRVNVQHQFTITGHFVYMKKVKAVFTQRTEERIVGLYGMYNVLTKELGEYTCGGCSRVAEVAEFKLPMSKCLEQLHPILSYLERTS